MKVTWTFCCSLLLGFLATSRARYCNVTHVVHCYDSLIHYEGLGFPLYGRDHLELVQTCRDMDNYFKCLDEYVGWCIGRKECDEECQEIIEDIDNFYNNTGLRYAQKELCNLKSSLREAYLENYHCLESNENNYNACHNVSLASHEYMGTIHDPEELKAAKCCFFTWLHDCFTNTTRDNCNENATLFVSFTIHTLYSQMSPIWCGPNPDICTAPPLPIAENVTDPLLEDNNVTDVDNSLEKTEKEIENWEDSVRKELNKTMDELDNSLESQPKSPGSSHTYSLWTVTMSFFFLLSCYIL